MTNKMITRTVAAVTLITVLAVTSPLRASAAETTPTSAPRTATSSATAQLDELKARLATKVAELRTLVKRAMYGTVKTVSLTSATIETKTKDIKIELTDDVTVAQMLTGKRTALALDDIEVGDPVTVFGSYDETLDLLKAQHIFIESSAAVSRVTGVVSDADSENFQLTLITRENRSITIDFERMTKTVAWNRESGLAKGGFSKISVGDTLHVTGKPDPKNANRVSAVRILDLGNITGAAVTPTVAAAEESATPTATVRPRRTPTPTQVP